jgi:chromate reductase
VSSIPRVLGISGSLRRDSFNGAILKTLEEATQGRVAFESFGLGEIPLYNQDLDGDAPPAAVVRLKQAVKDADGVVIASPEYNYGIPGVLKNALDWASRPGYNSVFKGKPVLVITASPGAVGGVRAQAQIRETLAALLARPVPTPEIVVPSVNAKVVGGRLADAKTLEFMLAGIEALLIEVERARKV